MARHSRGFTLIELLVVLVLLGSLIGLAVIGSGLADPGRELREEAERLAGLIAVLADEAVLDNREYGLYLTRDAYQVLRYDDVADVWRPLGAQSRRLPGWAELSLELDGDPASLPSLAKRAPDAKVPPPQVLMLSSGEQTPFRLRLREQRQDGQRLLLVSDGFRLPRVQNEPAAGPSE